MNAQVIPSSAPAVDLQSSVLQSIHLELRQGIRLQRQGDGWSFNVDGREVIANLPSGSAVSLFEMLKSGGCSLFDIARLPEESGRKVTAATELKKLWKYGWLVQTIANDSVSMATLQNFGSAEIFPSVLSVAERLYLSEDAYLRRAGSSLAIESVACGATVLLNNSLLFDLPAMLLYSCTVNDLSENLRLPDRVALAIVGWLLAIGAVELSQTSRSMALGWSFSDRLMHARSRRGRHIGGYGATFPLRDRIPEPPAIRPLSSDRSIQLAVPDLNEIKRREHSFTSVLEQRCSLREHSDTPMALQELSEFLYRIARVTARTRNNLYEVAARPYPSGGALHELEFYPLVNRCEILAAGLYRYNGSRHSLEHVSEPNAETRQLLAEAKQTCLMKGEPHVLILIAARFLRVNWKYESIAYALVLKNVGVVYQTMYLVATAMGLGPCALGGGNADGFCRAAQLDYWEESLVGEFMLGRPAQS